MEHKAISEPPGFAELSKAEKVRYLQDLWDRIAEQPGDLPIPESHVLLAEERLADYRRDPIGAHSPHEVLERLAGKRR